MRHAKLFRIVLAARTSFRTCSGFGSVLSLYSAGVTFMHSRMDLTSWTGMKVILLLLGNDLRSYVMFALLLYFVIIVKRIASLRYVRFVVIGK